MILGGTAESENNKQQKIHWDYQEVGSNCNT